MAQATRRNFGSPFCLVAKQPTDNLTHLFGMQKQALPLLLLFLFVSSAFGQAKTSHKVTGTLADNSGMPIVGAIVRVSAIEEDIKTDIRTPVSDNKGKFELDLPPGDYVLTVGEHLSPDARLVLKVPEYGPIPGDITFTVDAEKYCCSDKQGKKYPTPTVLPKPPYPAAARAVRARGEVVVKIELNDDGSVKAAQAVSGHPLLRVASVNAAKGSKFAAPDEASTRSVSLVYVFIVDGEGLLAYRHSNPYRIEVISAVEIISH